MAAIMMTEHNVFIGRNVVETVVVTLGGRHAAVIELQACRR
jgi:hypothetical protein